MVDEVKVKIWDAINEYVATCGGNPLQLEVPNICARNDAIRSVEQALHGMLTVEREQCSKNLWDCVKTNARGLDVVRCCRKVLENRGTIMQGSAVDVREFRKARENRSKGKP